MAYGNEKSDKRWEIRSIQIAQPAAGAEWSITVPAGQVWRFLMGFAQFTASSTVANRAPSLKFTDGTNTLGQVVNPNSVTASQTQFMNYARGVAFSASNSNHLLPIPDEIVLPPGAVLSSVTVGLQTGDQYSSISLLVESADAN